MNKVKSFFTRMGNKAKVMCSMAVASCMAAVATIVSSAEDGTTTEVANYSDQIIEQFTGAAEGIIPIIVGVMGAGLTIFVVFVGIRFGKKMFNTVSK